MRTETKYYHTVGETEFELPIKPSEGYDDFLVYENAEGLMLGYLFDDPDVQDPQEDDCMFGNIYSAHRNSGTHKEMQKALGLNSDWQPDLDLIEEEAVVERAFKVLEDSKSLVAGTVASDWTCAAEHFLDYWTKEPEESLMDAMKRSWDNENDLSDAGVPVDGIRQALWSEGRLNGTIGDKHAVSLDVYEHGLVSYSVSGSGTQCQWDTAKGGAVWVPSEEARAEIVRRGVVYQKGKIQKARLKNRDVYTVHSWLKFGVLSLACETHDHWDEAFKALEEFEPNFIQSVYDAEYDAAKELAAQSAETYTNWCNGNCYGFCIVAYDKDANEVDSDDCGGFIGTDYAKSRLQEEFDSRKQNL